MKNRLYLLIPIVGILSTMLVACGAFRRPAVVVPQNTIINLELAELPTPNQFVNLDYGIILKVQDKRANDDILSRYDVASNISRPIVEVYPEVTSFVNESMATYAKTLGFVLDSDINTDYLMEVNIQQFQISFLSGIGWMGTVVMDVQLYDSNRKAVMPVVTLTGRSKLPGGYNDFLVASNCMSDAYKKALDSYNWSKVAFFLKAADHASMEGNKRVSGNGDTALENMVIRWFVDSSPKGADVYWRVVSSTPEVKNTNMNYLGSTPFESTETFDIMGLTYNTSGNVQIEISCEKNGYIRQTRRFNLRQVIDQKEISTKFNLISEE